MRILNIPDGQFPEPAPRAAEPGPSPAPAPAPVPVPAPDLGRVDALEDITKSILGKLHAIEERIEALEELPIPAVPSPDEKISEPAPRTTHAPLTLKTDAIKKDLFGKMWKYLNDKNAAA